MDNNGHYARVIEIIKNGTYSKIVFFCCFCELQNLPKHRSVNGLEFKIMYFGIMSEAVIFNKCLSPLFNEVNNELINDGFVKRNYLLIYLFIYIKSLSGIVYTNVILSV